MKTLLCGIMLLAVTYISDAQLQSSSFLFDGLSREYFVFLPQNFEPGMPVVINLHGSGSDDAQWLINYTLMNNIADTAGFIAVYPQSISPRWNANCSIPGKTEPNVDDVGFISALIDTLNLHYNIDMDRIYCCGLNYGGWMASELICQIGNRFAAGARVNASLGNSQAARCKLTRPFPMILFNGTADTYLPWPDGKTGVMGGEEAIQWWVERNGCIQDPDTIALPDLDATDNCTVEKISYLSCAENVEVIFYKVINGGLSWPGAVGDETWDKPRNMDINAGVEIWNFFKRFERSSVYIPDTAFLHALIEEGVDTNGDSLISYAEAELVTKLTLTQNMNVGGNRSLSGIEAFINLDSLVTFGYLYDSLDFSYNTKLTYLNINNPFGCGGVTGGLKSLNISNNLALEHLSCVALNLPSLDVSNNTSLKYLNCRCNDIETLDLSNNQALTELNCGTNGIKSLDLSNCPNLTNIVLDDDFLTEVCVWTLPFPPSGVEVSISESTPVCFQTDCNGDCTIEITLTVTLDTIYQPATIEAKSSEDGMIYLVPVDTDKDLEVIRVASMDSIEAVMNTTVNMSMDGIENGTYWLYAIDNSGNISEPNALTVMGVGVEQRYSENLRIYPNPTYTQLTIETVTSDLINIQITSLNGQLIFSKEMEGASHQLDLSSFQKGVYFITVRSKDFVTTRKVVKL